MNILINLPRKASFLRRFFTLALFTAISITSLPFGGHGRTAAMTPQASENVEKPKDKVSPGLRDVIGSRSPSEIVPVIFELKASPSVNLNALLARSNVRIKGQFVNFNMTALNLPVATVAELASYPEVSLVDYDSKVRVLGHVTSTTGAEQVRTSLGASTTLNGDGIGIAVLDSGVYPEHKSLMKLNGVGGVVFNRDFTGEGRTEGGRHGR
jgi:hypothetical protein